MEALGIQPKLLLAQIVNFIIVLLLLRKFLYNPILSMLDQRSRKIATGLKEAEEAKKCLKTADSKSAELIAAAEKEANKIIEEAKEEAKKKQEEIMLDANEKAAKVINNAQTEANTLKEKALDSAKKELSQTMILAMEKVLSNDLDLNQKEILTRNAIKEL